MNDKNEIFEYYLDITDGMKIENGVPYYKDLFLDIIYYNNKEERERLNNYILRNILSTSST